MTELTYKEEKEAWVTGCMGGSIIEIQLLASTVLVSHCLWLALLSNAQLFHCHCFWVQYIVYVVPIVFSQTILADHVGMLLIGMLLLAFGIHCNQGKQDNNRTIGKQPQLRNGRVQQSSTGSDNFKKQHSPYLTVYRAATMLLTCVAILAVDFRVFPRRLAKVETFGTSLMDVGVGSFVFSSGLVASRAFIAKSSAGSFLSQLQKSLKTAAPLLFLGVARLVATKSVDYQLHSSEYGLHWNFFITLGLLSPGVTVLGQFAKDVSSFMRIGTVVVIAYQLVLYQGLQDWVLHAPRTDMISANKEGICSFIGYLGIFCIGVDIGALIFTDDSKINRDARGPQSLAIQLGTRGAISWSILFAWSRLLTFDGSLGISRRLANLPYVVWVVAFNVSLLSILVLLDTISSKRAAPALLHYINVNGLATFLFANILTGVVNLTLKTLYASTDTSMLILCLYMLVVTYFPWFMWTRFQFRLKL
ncbi:hypothetical protein DM01DRAFT_1337251 [Hesseltinella vesiculosa]|uniref:GPI-anchored wall transfer protein n=1 Tax=Hesseltinella vesiculosa TaxID=101127 RepID=A0A1X2GDC8_9FUNG|nr:hypothetical protein DM01DRAFT_1337251 [Hesseltinella vesiculosa]